MSPLDNIFTLPAEVFSSCLAIVSAVMVGGLFLWPALQYGTGYQTVWEIRPSAETPSGIHWRRFYVQLTHVLIRTFWMIRSTNLPPSPLLDNMRVMVIVWRLRGNIIRTALCWVVWHNVHSQQNTHVSSSYRSSRLGLSRWDPYAMHRGGCLELYYCNMV